mmetsp:Transcript_17091/g.41726  ORF Transcript_17091/g.41726 Transcript_17091/m.41726 type:complete len:216 (+) Transcript_17091:3112-3759(+)
MVACLIRVHVLLLHRNRQSSAIRRRRDSGRMPPGNRYPLKADFSVLHPHPQQPLISVVADQQISIAAKARSRGLLQREIAERHRLVLASNSNQARFSSVKLPTPARSSDRSPQRLFPYPPPQAQVLCRLVSRLSESCARHLRSRDVDPLAELEDAFEEVLVVEEHRVSRRGKYSPLLRGAFNHLLRCLLHQPRCLRSAFEYCFQLLNPPLGDMVV